MRFKTRASLRLWERRLRYRRKRLAAARRRLDRQREKKWYRLARAAEYWVSRRRRELRPPLRVRALNVMLKWQREKVREQGGNNIGPEVSAIIRQAGGTPGEPWCGDAVAAAYLDAGINPRKVTRAWAYVPTLARVLTRVRNPLPGHVVTFDFQGDGIEDHTGLFVAWVNRGAGIFKCAEGNTRPGTAASDSGGGEGVHIRERNVSQVASFRRVR